MNRKNCEVVEIYSKIRVCDKLVLLGLFLLILGTKFLNDIFS